MRVDIEHVEQLQNQLKQINDVPFFEIEWYKNGQLQQFDEDSKIEWVFTGLNNTSFITSEYYLKAGEQNES
jgi:hypothetical protein